MPLLTHQDLGMSSHPLNVHRHVRHDHRDASFVDANYGANFDASYDATCSDIESNAIYVHPNATGHVHHEVSNEGHEVYWKPMLWNLLVNQF